MESEEAVKLRAASTAIEGKLEDARNKMRLGATIGGDFVELSSVGLRSKMRVDPKEEVRRACWDGLRTIGDFVVANGFVELVASRNQMAKALGYVDYYDYKVTQAEGFGKAELFKILDTLEAGTRPLMKEARARLEADKGASALQPWNSAFAMAGDVTKKLDPFFPFGRARVPGSRAGLACRARMCHRRRSPRRRAPREPLAACARPARARPAHLVRRATSQRSRSSSGGARSRRSASLTRGAPCVCTCACMRICGARGCVWRGAYGTKGARARAAGPQRALRRACCAGVLLGRCSAARSAGRVRAPGTRGHHTATPPVSERVGRSRLPVAAAARR